MNISLIVKQLIENQSFNLHIKKVCNEQSKKSHLSQHLPQTNPLTFKNNQTDEKQNLLLDLCPNDQHQNKQSLQQKRFSISSSNWIKRNSRESLSSLTATNYFKLKSSTEVQVRIDDLVKQIAGMLLVMKNSETNQLHLQQQLKQYQIMKRVEQMQLQFQKEYQNKFNSQKESLRNQLEALVIQVNKKIKKQKNKKKIGNKTKILKKQRKNVAESILDITRNNRQFSGFHQIQQPSNFCSDSESFSESQEMQKSIIRNSQQLSSISSKLQKAQKINEKKIKQMWEKFKHELDQNTKDIQKITDRIMEWKLRNEQKIQNGFSGIWNIITEKEDQVSKLNVRIQLIQEYIGVKDL